MNKLLFNFITIVMISTSCLQASYKIAYADSMTKIRMEKEYASDLPIVSDIDVDMAANESESFQLVIIPDDSNIEEVFVNFENTTFDADELAIEYFKVGYVKTGKPKKYDPLYVGYWPDRLMPVDTFDVKSENVAVLWFKITTNKNIRRGSYKTDIRITSARQSDLVELNVKVRDFVIPEKGTFAAPFGLYLPYISKWYFSDEDYIGNITPEQYGQMCESLYEYRLTPKNIGYEYVHRKIGDQVLPQAGANAGRIFVHKDMSKPISVDMESLQKTIGRLGDQFPDYSYGIYRLPPYEELLKDADITNGQRDTSRENLDNLVLPALAHIKEWKKQNLSSVGYIYGVDEPREFHLGFLKELYTKIKAELPDVKILQVISTGDPSKLEGLVDIWCPLTILLHREYDFFQKRVAAGDMLWTYVCCWPEPPFANFFIDEPGIDHRALFWQAQKAGATGLLYWSVAWFEGLEELKAPDGITLKEPVDMTKHEMYGRSKVNGDGLLLYPAENFQFNPSIRLEIIKDGIEDCEYFSLLKALVQEVENIKSLDQEDAARLSQARKLIAVPDDIVEDMINHTSRSNDITDHRRKIADAIESLMKIKEKRK
ncbi:MAG: DUF4091 domain-containing protein [Sedimentisphaeraceae bacterium JB056]